MESNEIPTIFALSSAPGRSGVAVIRVSGSRALDTGELLTGSRLTPRHAHLSSLRNPADGGTLDRAIVIAFPGPASFTGEDVVEFHVHGGRAVVAIVLWTLGQIEGLRQAEAGEFARRAFENGRLDLTQAEGLADLIDAETEAQRRRALIQAGGELRRTYDDWRNRLIEARALVEADLDFSDESDVGSGLVDQACRSAAALRDEIRAHLDDGRRGEILRDGFRVALTGAPNAGKSLLLNALARRDVAIVSEHAGTTRDVIEVRLDISGLPVIISDTAGIRASTDSIETEGIRRTLAVAAVSDLVIWLTVAPEPDEPPAELLTAAGDGLTIVANKADLVGRPQQDRADRDGEVGSCSDGTLTISALTGEGFSDLVAEIGRRATDVAGRDHGPVLTRERHRTHLEECVSALDRCLAGHVNLYPELMAEELRFASNAVGAVTGHVKAEDVLDRIFAGFCIGK